ncbi:MAG: amino acid permease [Candidatus Aminicenantes bacterium]|nr:amino acid permease [Candidatus Aminicenantes bacterium]
MANNEGNGLQRKLGLFPVTNIVIANMIGAGIFTTSGLLMGDLKNPLIMIALWIVGGMIALAGALSYGEVGATIPRAGGEYVFLSRLYRPVLGFLSGWVSFFGGFSAPIAASAIGFSEYMTRAFPWLLNPGIFPASYEAVFIKKFFAVLVIFAFTIIHARGIEAGARVQNALTVLKVVLIVGLIVLGFAFGKGSISHLGQGGGFRFDFGGWKTIGLSLMWIMFAYSGWNAAAYIGSEIKNPTKNLPRSLILGTGVVILIYLSMNLLYIYALPPAEMNGVISIGGLAVANLFGSSFESVLSVLISFALFSSLSAFIILGPRVYYAMAKDRHFFRFAGEVHPRYGVPSKSILLQGGIAGIMVLLGTFDQILTYMGFSLAIFPLLVVFGVFKLRREKKSVFKLPGFPYVPLFYLVTGLMILSLGFFERPVESSIAVLTVLAGIPVFLAFKKRSARQAELEPNPSQD